jgi:hypothetical protein
MEVAMIRSLILTLTILVLASTPTQARGGGHGSHGGGHGSHGGHGHSGHHHHSHPFGGFLFGVLPGPFFTQFPYGYPCWWDEGHWVGQVYEDKYGNSTYAPEWVPGRWQCPEAEVDDALLI